MKHEDLYSVSDIVNFAIEKYQLHMDKNGKYGPKWNTYRQKISRVLHKTKLWDDGTDIVKGKKTIKYFTIYQVQYLFTNKALYDYLRENSASDAIYNSKRYADVEAEIDYRRQKFIDFYDSEINKDDIENYRNPPLTKEEVITMKNNIMLKALFEKFFTPIDETLLEEDMRQAFILYNDSDFGFERVEAEQRLAHPEGFYYHPKEIKDTSDEKK